MTALKLIVGLGNPGPQYDSTRHNIGACWVRELARQYGINLSIDTKFKGKIGRGTILGVDVRLLLPTTYMNLSGESVGAVVRFYKMTVDEVLIAYDETAFEPGIVRLKQGGGANGHNGIISVIEGCANDRSFHRLRIGVGHPGTPDRMTAYLTQHTMPAAQRQQVDDATNFSEALLGDILHGRWPSAQNVLHAQPGET